MWRRSPSLVITVLSQGRIAVPFTGIIQDKQRKNRNKLNKATVEIFALLLRTTVEILSLSSFIGSSLLLYFLIRFSFFGFYFFILFGLFFFFWFFLFLLSLRFWMFLFSSLVTFRFISFLFRFLFKVFNPIPPPLCSLFCCAFCSSKCASSCCYAPPCFWAISQLHLLSPAKICVCSCCFMKTVGCCVTILAFVVLVVSACAADCDTLHIGRNLCNLQAWVLQSSWQMLEYMPPHFLWRFKQ